MNKTRTSTATRKKTGPRIKYSTINHILVIIKQFSFLIEITIANIARIINKQAQRQGNSRESKRNNTIVTKRAQVKQNKYRY